MNDEFIKSAGRATIIATPEVWLEGEAERQLSQVAMRPDCARAVGMPDLHPGPGIPIGAAFGFLSTVHPHLVGGDAGCGALVVSLGKTKVSGSFERRVRLEFASPMSLDDSLFRSVWNRGPDGLCDSDLSAAALAVVDHIGDDTDGPSGQLPDRAYGAALGSIGGGNHFAELGQVTQVFGDESHDAAAPGKGELVLLCHSGSRGLGKALAEKWGHQQLSDSDASEYLADLAGAVRFARANRVLIAARMLRALGVSRACKVRGAFDLVHNGITREYSAGSNLWIHRKGCAPAHTGQLTVVLGSRGTPSWIMRGLGNPIGLASVAHGAGRKMKRSEARAKIRARYRRTQLRGGDQSVIVCDDTKLLYEEHPDVYKAIGPVIESIELAKLATRVASVKPLLTVKK